MVDFKTVARDLVQMAADDQAMRNNFAKKGWNKSIDQRNTRRLKAIIAKLGGWPIISQVGPEAATDAWLLAQHADADPAFQAEALAMLKALPEGEARLSHVAYLEDRVRINTGRPQLYGTQFLSLGDSFGPQPIEDEAQLDERRAAMGLQLFRQYRRQMEELYGHIERTSSP